MIREDGGFRIKGKVLRPSKGNLFLVTSDKLPPIGGDTFIKDGTRIGSLIDVIGKVGRPLLVISVSDAFRSRLKPGTAVFFSAPSRTGLKTRVNR